MEILTLKSSKYLQTLCVQIADRSVGSEGNRAATQYYENIASSLGWKTESQEFDAMDWIDGGASLTCEADRFRVFVSPYSLGCNTEGQLISLSSIDELETTDICGKIVLIHGELAKEQLMPKNFIFYNPQEHQHIISLLEKGEPQALICATGRNASLAGGVYPFPLIEDGDFNIPSVYMTDEEGSRLVKHSGKTVS
jgi:aminopeptidase YwaD